MFKRIKLLNENPDFIKKDGKGYTYRDNAIPFIIYDNKVYKGKPNTIHKDMVKEIVNGEEESDFKKALINRGIGDNIEKFNMVDYSGLRNDMVNGRLFLSPKVITFWWGDKTSKENILKTIKLLGLDNEWSIEDVSGEIMSFEEYKGNKEADASDKLKEIDDKLKLLQSFYNHDMSAEEKQSLSREIRKVQKERKRLV